MGLKNYYAVKVGRHKGIYNSWPEAKRQVNGYSGAVYKGFYQIEDAENYLYPRLASSKKVNKLKHVKKPKNTKLKKANSKKTNKGLKKERKAGTVSGRGGSYFHKTDNPIFVNKEYVGYSVFAWSDGGCRMNWKDKHVLPSDKASWAYSIEYQGNEYNDSSGEYGATNNKMEVTAFYSALKMLVSLGLNEEPIEFTLDSQYVIDTLTKHWIDGWAEGNWTRDIKNKGLWEDIYTLIPRFPKLHLNWTKGHASDNGNNRVDKMVNDTMDSMM